MHFTSNNIGLICSGKNSLSSEAVFESFLSLNFYQLNNILNSLNSQLDLVFSNNPQIIVKPFDNSIVPLDQYHPVLITKLVLVNNNSHKCPKSWLSMMLKMFLKIVNS